MGLFWFNVDLSNILVWGQTQNIELSVVLFYLLQFLESMQLNYHDQAAEKGVYIVGSCGFDSIPADIGVIYTRDQFKGMFVM